MKKLLKLWCFILAAVILFTVSAFALSRRGSQSEEVRQIQQKLKNWGYYDGAVDGIFGSQTEEAVKYFQRKNGLTADGIVGNATLAALGINNSSSSGASNYENNVNLLAHIISAESRGEPYVGMVAVGAVVLNRVKHPSFPNTIAGVIYQPGAFTAVVDGQMNEPITETAYKAARDALNGWDPTGGAIYYYNPAKTTSSWIYSREVIVTIGDHVFAR